MEEIHYLLKPDWVTWDDIKECMTKAHEVNRKKGVVMQNQYMTPDEFKDYYKDAYCFVALCDNKVIGTCSLRIIDGHAWWAKGIEAYTFGDAILPNYRGTDVFEKLNALRKQYIVNSKAKVVCFDTAENNVVVQKFNLRKGAKRVRLISSRKTWYYSVVMVIWLEGCPFSDWYCDFRYKLSCFLVKLVFKPGRKFRFWFS